MPHLEEVDIWIDDAVDFDCQEFFLKNVKRLHIDDHTNDGLPLLSYLSNEKVEDLSIHVCLWNDKVIDSICKFKAVKKLKLICCRGDFECTN